jgi:hypothetical protein
MPAIDPAGLCIKQVVKLARIVIVIEHPKMACQNVKFITCHLAMPDPLPAYPHPKSGYDCPAVDF